jgi:hypothetical protein
MHTFRSEEMGIRHYCRDKMHRMWAGCKEMDPVRQVILRACSAIEYISGSCVCQSSVVMHRSDHFLSSLSFADPLISFETCINSECQQTGILESLATSLPHNLYSTLEPLELSGQDFPIFPAPPPYQASNQIHMACASDYIY